MTRAIVLVLAGPVAALEDYQGFGPALHRPFLVAHQSDLEFTQRLLVP